MKRTLPLVLALFGLCSMSIHSNAQTTYTVVPGVCGDYTAPQINHCWIEMEPANSLGYLPAVQFLDLNVASSTEAQGYMQFNTVQGPSGGNLGSAQITSVVVDGSTVMIDFAGYYSPDSGSGPFTGSATLTITVQQKRINRWTVKTVAVIESGEVVIFPSLAPVADSPIAPTPNPPGCPPDTEPPCWQRPNPK